MQTASNNRVDMHPGIRSLQWRDQSGAMIEVYDSKSQNQLWNSSSCTSTAAQYSWDDNGSCQKFPRLTTRRTVTAIQQLEQDRNRDWENPDITTGLLETAYTQVIHSNDSGEPYPTTEAHPNRKEMEANYCPTAHWFRIRAPPRPGLARHGGRRF